MTERVSDPRVPRGALIAVAGLIGFTILASAGARIGGVASVEPAGRAAVESRDLHFLDRADGAVTVEDAADGGAVEVFAPGTNGFVRGVMRGLARERRLNDAGREPPFRLTRWTDGRLSLEDLATGRRIELDAFGATNRETFARLLGRGDRAS